MKKHTVIGRRKNEKIQFTLSPSEIDRFSDWLEEKLQNARTDKKNRLRFRLSAEEILLRVQTRFGEETAAEASLERNFGKTRLQIEIAGDAFNPLNESSDRFGEWNSSLLPAVGLEPKYAYAWGKNILRLYLPAKRMNPVLLIALAIVAGCILGFAGKFLLPETLRDKCTNVFFTPVYDVWFRILNALSGPVIFFTSMTTMLNTEQIVKQGGSKGYVLGRYFILSLLCAGLAALCAYPLFPPGDAAVRLSGKVMRETLETVFGTIPDNIFNPFFSSNTPQLLVLAIAGGTALSALGKHAEGLRDVVRQINMQGLLLARWVSLLVPLFTGVFLIFEIWNGQVANALLALWQPLSLFLAVSAGILCLAVCLLSCFMRVNPLVIAKKCLPPFVMALKTGTLDDALDDTERVCVRALGIDARFTKISLPQGAVLYMPVSNVGALIFTLYVAHIYGTIIDPVKLCFAILLVVILFVATPPVPGANLLAYIALFSWLGIPEAVLIIAMVFDIVTGIAANAGNLTLLQLETVFQARRMGLLDRETLTAGE